MDPFNSSNVFESEDQSIAEKLGANELRFETTYPDDDVNGHSFEEQSVGDAHLLQNPPIDNYEDDDDCDFSGVILKYVDEMLMEEELEEQTLMLQESLSFQAKERSFYEVLGQKYPPSPHHNSTATTSHSGYLLDPNWRTNCIVSNSTITPLSSSSSSSYNWNNSSSVMDPLQIGEEDERRNKVAAVNHPESSDIPIEEFDDVLFYTVGEREKKFQAYRADLLNAGSRKSSSSSSSRRPAKGKKQRQQQPQQQVIMKTDLTSLLINCAQSISDNDRRAADGLLKRIRQHSSPLGDANQRVAHYFVDGLEARLAGTQHKALPCKPNTLTSDYLRAYYTLLASSPTCHVTAFVANKSIAAKSGKAMRVHVIDFGILYGFQWPTLIQYLAQREGGPPKLRITGIDFPLPGFHPAQRIKEAGRRLARCAETFDVPFEYAAIAQKWETIEIEDLNIEEGEFVVVNCMYRAGNLQDETLDEEAAESPRSKVFKLVRKINPGIFVHGIVNGGYGVPFFVTRFREALFRFSAVYDLLETILPRESSERMLIEGIFGKEAMNVIACEGSKRVERPETYKQWQLRHLRAGFMAVPFERKLVERATYKVRKFYHRDFLIGEDDKWVLLGWKGRVINAISCWEPV